MDNKIIATLLAHKKDLDLFKVKRLAVFGSVARNEAGPDSDVDILVKFRGELSFDRYMDLKFYLEDLLGRKVDLVTEGGLRPELKSYIDQDLIRVA